MPSRAFKPFINKGGGVVFSVSRFYNEARLGYLYEIQGSSAG